MAANFWLLAVTTSILTTSAASELQCETIGRAVMCSARSDNVANNLDKGLVSDNRNTLRINLNDCRISRLAEDAFSGLTVLQNLDLSVNSIERLPIRVFEDTKKVTHLNLSHNLIEQFPEGIFENNPLLETLDLKNNDIVDLRVGLFDPLPKLLHLDLSDNSLFGRRLDSHLFDLAQNVRTIDFSGNNMANSSSILLRAFRSLHNLHLSRCKFENFPDFVTISNLGTMRVLMLNENQISNVRDVDTFKHLVNLEVLSLADNSIENIAAKVFTPLRNLKKLLLGGNRIQLFYEDTFKKLKKLNTIDLSDNAITEIDSDYFMETSVENLNLSGNKLTFLQENFCANMKKLDRNLRSFSFDNNPWQCTCLLNILQEVKKLNIVYNSFEFNGRVPVCVATREFSCKRLLLELVPPFE